ncbi:MAG: MarR family transcriptional regulator [Clostridia bacterium]|nr:MarR family transcriptional regulator [Clostridia bacterium]MBR2418354.1 MarR family transcriptional regulator [Clostridia bacterium]
MDKDILAKSLLDAFDSINKQELFEKMKIVFKGENLMLAILMDMGGKATPGELIKYTECTAARLTAIAKSLENKGFVKRIQNSEDKRSTIIEMTSEGIARFMLLQKESIERIFNLIEMLGENDAKEFVRLIKRLSEISSDTGLISEVTV